MSLSFTVAYPVQFNELGVDRQVSLKKHLVSENKDKLTTISSSKDTKVIVRRLETAGLIECKTILNLQKSSNILLRKHENLIWHTLDGR